jgi:protein TonB
MAFNYTSDMPVIEPFEIGPVESDDMPIPPITTHLKKPLPPPPPEKIQVVDIEPIADPIFESIEKIELVEEVKEEEANNVPEQLSEIAPFVEPIIENIEPEEKIFLAAERMPVYGDCDINENETERKNCTSINLVNHIYAKVRYPVLARKNQIEGTVVVSFIVNKQGNIEDVKIVRDIGMGCGKEVLKAVKKLDKFKPGKQNGRPVAVLYRFPVKFKLQ